MSINSVDIKFVYVDGQKLLFPSDKQWKNLRLDPIIDNMPLGVTDLLWGSQDFTRKYSELHVVLGRIIENWVPYVLLEINGAYQRIHLEVLKCSSCNWKGRTANPMVIDNYIGVGVSKKIFDLMKASEKYSIVSCPNCGNQLPRHPIWVEPKC